MDRLKEANCSQKQGGWHYCFNQLADIKNQVRVLYGVIINEEDIDAIIDTLVINKYITLTRENIPS